MKNIFTYLNKLFLIVGLFSLCSAVTPANAAIENATCFVQSDTMSVERVAVEESTNLDDHLCHRRCEHRYNTCVSYCHHGHQGNACRQRCEIDFRRCQHHCVHH